MPYPNYHTAGEGLGTVASLLVQCEHCSMESQQQNCPNRCGSCAARLQAAPPVDSAGSHGEPAPILALLCLDFTH